MYGRKIFETLAKKKRQFKSFGRFEFCDRLQDENATLFNIFRINNGSKLRT